MELILVMLVFTKSKQTVTEWLRIALSLVDYFHDCWDVLSEKGISFGFILPSLQLCSISWPFIRVLSWFRDGPNSRGKHSKNSGHLSPIRCANIDNLKAFMAVSIVNFGQFSRWPKELHFFCHFEGVIIFPWEPNLMSWNGQEKSFFWAPIQTTEFLVHGALCTEFHPPKAPRSWDQDQMGP